MLNSPAKAADTSEYGNDCSNPIIQEENPQVKVCYIMTFTCIAELKSVKVNSDIELIILTSIMWFHW